MTSSLPAASDAPPPGRAALNAPPKGATSHQTAENAPSHQPSDQAASRQTRHPAARDIPPPHQAAYLLDFDGTLVDIAPAPDLVTVDPSLPATLRALCQRTGGAVAIVTGRPIAQVDALLADTVTAIAGEHGTALRHQPGGPIETITLPAIPPHWRTAAQVAIDAHPGTLFEPKRHGFVLHYRARPDAGPPLLILLRALLAEQPGYELMAAKMAWEIRPAGVSKATAVHAIMRHPPFAGRIPIYIGDDVTDEDGIQAAIALGGLGLRVPETFDTPAHVRAWLAGQAGQQQESK